MEKLNEKLSKNKNHFNISNNKFDNKKEDLCKKYFYKLNLAPKHKNIFHDLENGQNLDELEQVYNENLIFMKGKNELLQKKEEILKSMILHHKNIPERWILQNNYKNLLDNVLKDPIVLSYAIFSKDVHKKRSTTISIDIDDIKKYYSLSPKEPKFISYINPYSRNFDESNKKHKIRKEYGYYIKNKKDKAQNIYTLHTDNNERNKFRRNLYLNTEINKEKELPNIFDNKKKRNENDERKTEDKNEITMMTSLYFDENKLNKKTEKKGKYKEEHETNKINDNDENKEQEIKKQKIELPIIEY